MVIAITGTPSRADCLAFVDPFAYRLAQRLKRVVHGHARACPPSRRALDLVLKRNKNGEDANAGHQNRRRLHHSKLSGVLSREKVITTFGNLYRIPRWCVEAELATFRHLSPDTRQ
jgi:hypothetical protein